MTDLTYALYGRITAALLSLRNDERGQGMVEYSLILALVSLIAIVALGLLGNKVSTTFNGIVSQF